MRGFNPHPPREADAMAENLRKSRYCARFSTVLMVAIRWETARIWVNMGITEPFRARTSGDFSITPGSRTRSYAASGSTSASPSATSCGVVRGRMRRWAARMTGMSTALRPMLASSGSSGRMAYNWPETMGARRGCNSPCRGFPLPALLGFQSPAPRRGCNVGGPDISGLEGVSAIPTRAGTRVQFTRRALILRCHAVDVSIPTRAETRVQ